MKAGFVNGLKSIYSVADEWRWLIFLVFATAAVIGHEALFAGVWALTAGIALKDQTRRRAAGARLEIPLSDEEARRIATEARQAIREAREEGEI